MLKSMKKSTSIWERLVAPLKRHATVEQQIAFGSDFLAQLERLRIASLKALGGGLREGHRLGGYKGGRMLFLGTGTGLGSAMVLDGVLVPLELAHLPYKNGCTYEDYIGLVGLERRGKKKWRKSVLDIVELLRAAMVCDSVLLGGGNAKFMKDLPAHVVVGSNENAVTGGFRLWEDALGKRAAKI